MSVGATGGTTTVATAHDWVIIAATKAAGTITPNVHIYKNGAWVHEPALATVANTTSQAGGTVRFASFSGIAFYQFDLAVAGEWQAELTNLQIEELVTNRRTRDWAENTAGTPSALWELNQVSVATPITDLTGAGAEESLRTDTEVITSGPQWTYGVGVRDVPILARPEWVLA